MKNKLKIIMSGMVFSALLILLPGVSKAAMEWNQVKDGFDGDSNANTISFMTVFNDRLYVAVSNVTDGAEIWSTDDGSVWTQSNIDGFDNDPNNGTVNHMIVYNNRLYVSTNNWMTGTEIWSTANGTAWSRFSNLDGFNGSAGNSAIYDMIVFNNNLYAATYNYTGGTEVWYTSDGNTWIQSGVTGYDCDVNNISTYGMSIFNNRLFTATFNSIFWGPATGTEIWSTGNGTSWTQSNADGFDGDANNMSAFDTVVFNNKLFAGTWNTVTGTEIWSRPSGGVWSQNASDGFDGDNNNSSTYFVIYNNGLYATVGNGTSGSEVWSTSDGASWNQVNNDGFDGDSNNSSITRRNILNNRLYLTTLNGTTGSEVWYTDNGTSWTQSNVDGFNGDSANNTSLASAVFNNKLYIGVYDSFIYSSLPEIWALSDVTDPTISNQSPSNSSENVDIDTSITFRVNDEDSGIDSDTISVIIEGSSAISNGVCQTGYTCSINAYGFRGYDVVINSGTNYDYSQEINIEVGVSDIDGNNSASLWSFKTEDEPEQEPEPKKDPEQKPNKKDSSIVLDPKILTISGPGEPTRLWTYDRHGIETNIKINSGLFPDSYIGGAGIVSIDQNNNNVLDQFLIFAIDNGGPQARVMGLREDGSAILKGQMFVFDSSVRDGLSATSGDFDNDGYQDDAAFCLTGDYEPHVKVYRDVSGIDNWELINEFTIPNVGPTGCNLGNFQYDNGASELLIASNHGSALPNVYIYSVAGKEKLVFPAYDNFINQGLTATSINDRIYTTPNNGTSHIMAFDKNGEAKNFWWAYQQHVRGNFKGVPGDIDLDGKDELIISPIGQNGTHVISFEPTGKARTWPNFFAFGDENLRNGVGIAVIENYHGIN